MKAEAEKQEQTSGGALALIKKEKKNDVKRSLQRECPNLWEKGSVCAAVRVCDFSIFWIWRRGREQRAAHHSYTNHRLEIC